MTTINLTEQDMLEIKYSFEAGERAVNIAERFNISQRMVYKKLAEIGIEDKYKYLSKYIPFSSQDLENMVRWYTEMGMSAQSIAVCFNVSKGVILRALKRMGVDTSPVRHTINHDFFEIINTEEKAYCLGFITTDGNISGNRVRIGLKIIDIEHLEKLKIIFNATHNIYIYNNEACHLEITSPKMVADLAKYGIVDRKSSIIKPYYQIPPNFIIPYLRGMVDGDGWVYILEDPYLRACIGLCGTYEICEYFKNWCNLHSSSTASIISNGSICSYNIRGKSAIPLIDTLYSGSTIHLDRKYEKAIELLNIFGG